MEQLSKGVAYELTMAFMEGGKQAPRAIDSGYVRFVLDDTGNGLDVSFTTDGGVRIRVMGPDMLPLSVLPRHNGVDLRIEESAR